MMNCSIRKLTERDISEGLELAYKAAYEHGFVDTEFNKTSFNFKVKNVFYFLSTPADFYSGDFNFYFFTVPPGGRNNFSFLEIRGFQKHFRQ